MINVGNSFKDGKLTPLLECSICGYRTFGEKCTNEYCGTKSKLKWKGGEK